MTKPETTTASNAAAASTLTLEKLAEVMRQLRPSKPSLMDAMRMPDPVFEFDRSPVFSHSSMMMGMQIFQSERCIERVWNFPQSQNRSRRLHKKLMKRFGVQSFERPAAYMMADKLVAHPKVITEMVASNQIVRCVGIA